MLEDGFCSGFVAIVGRPNVGKSTLLNCLLEEKIAIVSDKPQTTRNQIRGILSQDTYQIVFIDTPGIHEARDEINRYMVQAARSTFKEVDLILFMVDASHRIGKGDRMIGQAVEKEETPVLLLVNKMDTVSLEDGGAVVEQYRREFPETETYPLSALTGEGVKSLLSRIVEGLPEGGPFFPPDQLADQPVRFLCAEMIREKVFNFTGEEIPYAVAVEIFSFKESAQGPSGLISIDANLHVERSSQKGILIGKNGQMLKKIGTAARKDMEDFLGTKVFLKLWVKVTKGWRNDPKSLRWLGYR